MLHVGCPGHSAGDFLHLGNGRVSPGELVAGTEIIVLQLSHQRRPLVLAIVTIALPVVEDVIVSTALLNVRGVCASIVGVEHTAVVLEEVAVVEGPEKANLVPGVSVLVVDLNVSSFGAVAVASVAVAIVHQVVLADFAALRKNVAVASDSIGVVGSGDENTIAVQLAPRLGGVEDQSGATIASRAVVLVGVDGLLEVVHGLLGDNVGVGTALVHFHFLVDVGVNQSEWSLVLLESGEHPHTVAEGAFEALVLVDSVLHLVLLGSLTGVLEGVDDVEFRCLEGGLSHLLEVLHVVHESLARVHEAVLHVIADTVALKGGTGLDEA